MSLIRTCTVTLLYEDVDRPRERSKECNQGDPRASISPLPKTGEPSNPKRYPASATKYGGIDRGNQRNKSQRTPSEPTESEVISYPLPASLPASAFLS